jgi:hypothetical protein
MLRAVWHGLRGDWHAAHELAQAQDDADGAWVHAWLHRIEGDLGNADYWYRHAHRHAPRRHARKGSDRADAQRIDSGRLTYREEPRRERMATDEERLGHVK